MKRACDAGHPDACQEFGDVLWRMVEELPSGLPAMIKKGRLRRALGLFEDWSDSAPAPRHLRAARAYVELAAMPDNTRRETDGARARELLSRLSPEHADEVEELLNQLESALSRPAPAPVQSTGPTDWRQHVVGAEPPPADESVLQARIRAGDTAALMELAEVYSRRKASPSTRGQIQGLVRRAAQVESPAAYGTLGDWLLEYRPGLRDFAGLASARRWYEKGARAGDPGSAFRLAFTYLSRRTTIAGHSGRAVAGDVDVARARYWLSKAAELGHEAAEAVLQELGK